MNIQKAYEGASADTGVLPLIPLGLPAHLKPSADRLARGSDISGDQRVNAVDHVFVQDTPNMTLACTFSGGTGSAQLQVCSGDPSVAANWVDAGAAVTANGSDSYSGQHLFARVSVTNAGGGIQVQLLLGNA